MLFLAIFFDNSCKIAFNACLSCQSTDIKIQAISKLWILPLKSFGSRHVFLSQETKIKRQKGDDKTLDFAFIFLFFLSGFKYLKVTLGTNNEDTKFSSQ